MIFSFDSVAVPFTHWIFKKFTIACFITNLVLVVVLLCVAPGPWVMGVGRPVPLSAVHTPGAARHIVPVELVHPPLRIFITFHCLACRRCFLSFSQPKLITYWLLLFELYILLFDLWRISLAVQQKICELQLCCSPSVFFVHLLYLLVYNFLTHRFFL